MNQILGWILVVPAISVVIDTFLIFGIWQLFVVQTGLRTSRCHPKRRILPRRIQGVSAGMERCGWDCDGGGEHEQ
jgi:hypothetical protein